MTVLNPSDTDHTLKIVPRYYPQGNVTLVLYDEATQKSESVVVAPDELNGYLYVSFTKTFLDNSNYQVCIEQATDVVYRGKIFVTNQAGDTQGYQISKDIFVL